MERINEKSLPSNVFFFCLNLQASVVTGRVEPFLQRGDRAGRKGRVKGQTVGEVAICDMCAADKY